MQSITEALKTLSTNNMRVGDDLSCAIHNCKKYTILHTIHHYTVCYLS